MSTVTEARTVQRVLESANLAQLAEAFKVIGFGTFLEQLLTPVTEVLVLDASLQATLAKRPLVILSAGVSEDGNVGKNSGLMQSHSAATLGQLSYHVDYGTRVCTFVSYQAADAAVALAQNDEVTVTYLGLTVAADGTDQSEIERVLDLVFGRT